MRLKIFLILILFAAIFGVVHTLNSRRNAEGGATGQTENGPTDWRTAFETKLQELEAKMKSLGDDLAAKGREAREKLNGLGAESSSKLAEAKAKLAEARGKLVAAREELRKMRDTAGERMGEMKERLNTAMAEAEKAYRDLGGLVGDEESTGDSDAKPEKKRGDD